MVILVQNLSNNYRFISQYSRVSICLDFELICAQQSQREAFSINEADETRFRLTHLSSCQQDLDDIWRSSRWLVDVINCAKDKSYAGISLKSWLNFQSQTSVQLKITASDSSSVNYASDSALDTVKFSSSTLALPSTITSTSLSSSFLNDTSLITNCDSGFIELEGHERYSGNRASTISSSESNDPIELTLYIPILTSNNLIPLKLRSNRLTSAYELLQLICKQQHVLLKSISTLSSSSAFVFVWIRSNGREQLIEDGLTAAEIEKRLMRFGGQIHVRTRGLSSSRSSQPLTASPSTSRLSPSNPPPSNSSRPGSNLSLNLQ